MTQVQSVVLSRSSPVTGRPPTTRRPSIIASTAGHANWRTGKRFHDLKVGDQLFVSKDEYARVASARAYYKKWYKRTYGKNITIRSEIVRNRTGVIAGYVFCREK